MPSPLRRTYAITNLTDEPDTPSTTQTIIRHHQYYLPSGDLFILINTTLFCIHKYFFEQEATKLFVPPYTNPDDNTLHGTFASHPIILHDVSIYDFEQFLWVFYNPRLSLYDNTPGNWWSIGCLAGHWGFDKVLNLVKQELEKLKDIFYHKAVEYAWSPEDPTDHAICLHLEDDHGP